MKNSINEAMKGLLNATLCEIEKKFDGDVLNYYGPIIDGNENALCDIIEELEENGHRKATLIVILTILVEALQLLKGMLISFESITTKLFS